MKIIFLTFFCFLSVIIVGQNSVIIKKDGSRIEFVKGSIQLIIQDKVLSYKSPSGSQKELDFKEVDYAFFGNYKFKYFKFQENKMSNGYFVLAESVKYSLICIGIPENDEDEGAVSSKVKYQMYILDKENAVVDGLAFSNHDNSKSATARSLISEKINLYFKDCDNLLTRLADFERLNEPQYMGLIGFFRIPNYVNCVD